MTTATLSEFVANLLTDCDGPALWLRTGGTGDMGVDAPPLMIIGGLLAGDALPLAVLQHGFGVHDCGADRGSDTRRCTERTPTRGEWHEL